MRILAIDPGVNTGYCYAAIRETDRRLLYHPFQATDDVDDFWRRLKNFKPKYLVMEDFDFRGGARKGLNLFPVQLIGVARLYSLIAPVGQDGAARLFLQKPATGKAYYTDAALKALNLHKRGIPHGMDASRHLLQWSTFGYGYQFMTEDKKDFAQIVPMEAFAGS
jgi:hypothetical protein